MPRAIYRLSDDVPSPWLRPTLFQALKPALAEIDVEVVLGRPGTLSGVTQIADELSALECAAIADSIYEIVGRVVATRAVRATGGVA